MSLPNLITIGRILLVPLTVWLIVSGDFLLAFLVFITAGVSDAVDGILARRLNLRTELGGYLDPLADKLLLVSIYVTLGFQRQLPAWLVILVASRDIMIVGAVILSWLMDKPISVKPLMVSKANTVAQIMLAGIVLAVLGFGLAVEPLLAAGYIAVAALTVASVAFYMVEWVGHMANGG
ncbi:MAG: CDP-alcohol phosphatidyltransferase family protein [Hyphomicrobiales bacterium]